MKTDDCEVNRYKNEENGMNDQEFADRFFLEAINNGFLTTSYGNIKCPHGKNLSKDMLKTIHGALGKVCPDASSFELKQAKIESCCFTLFRRIAKLIYP